MFCVTVFTYDVVFKSSPVRWASRWDTYLQTQDREIHWFSVVNSMMILLFLSGMVAMIMIRTLRRDITQYNQLETVEETAEETGWKLVHGDVFRPAPRARRPLRLHRHRLPAPRHDLRHHGLRRARLSLPG